MSDEILRQVASFRTLQQVMAWALGSKPPAELVDVIGQDEFTHDVVIRVREDYYLVFDTN